MARWLVQLKGEAASLEDFSYHFPNGPIYAIAEQDEVFLVGESFENYSEASEVHGAALQAVDEFSAIISLFWSDFERPSISLVLRESDEGRRHAHIFAPSFLPAMRGRLRLSSQATQGPTRAQQLLQASRKDRHLRAAVLVWGDPLQTWPRLYHVLDEIEKALGKSVSKAAFCTKPELNRFTQTANSAEAVGKDARHGLGRVTPHPNPMSLQEATNFIGRLLERALSQQV